MSVVTTYGVSVLGRCGNIWDDWATIGIWDLLVLALDLHFSFFGVRIMYGVH